MALHNYLCLTAQKSAVEYSLFYCRSAPRILGLGIVLVSVHEPQQMGRSQANHTYLSYSASYILIISACKGVGILNSIAGLKVNEMNYNTRWRVKF